MYTSRIRGVSPMSLSGQWFAFQQNMHSPSVIPNAVRELLKRKESTQTTENFTFCAKGKLVNENREA